MGSKEKILKNKLFWASAAIASSLLFSQLVLGTPVSVSADTNESTSTQSTQNQAAAFHDMNQHSNESGAGMPNTNAANGVELSRVLKMAIRQRRLRHRQIFRRLLQVR